jgi:PAS domain S-box-containing protein
VISSSNRFDMMKTSENEILEANRDLHARVEELQSRVSELEAELDEANLGLDHPDARACLEFCQHAPDMFLTVDARTARILRCNATTVEKLGYAENELVGRKFFDLMHEDGLELSREVFFRFRDTHEVRHAKLVFRRADGSKLPARLNAAALSGRGGKAHASLWVVRDMTELQGVEEALEEANRELRRVMESVPDYLWSGEMRRGQWAYRYYSPVVEGITGRPPEYYLAGQNRWLDTLHAEDRPRMERLVESLLRGDHQDVTAEYRVLRPDGAIRWVRDHVFVDRSDPERVMFNGVVTDITNERKLEEEMDRRRDELAHVTRLGMLGEMVAGITHEIMQPLSSILNFVGAGLTHLEQGQGQGAQSARACFEQIGNQAERAGQIIRRLRRFGRKGVVDMTEVDLHGIVWETLELFAPEARRARVQVDVDLPPGVPSAYADRIQIQQVLLNLLYNACEALGEAPMKERRIVVQVVAGEAELEVRVRDRGPGVPLENADKIFTAFYTTKPKGLGIGLSISRSIVEAHGGKLRATPNADRGMTFAFTLPLRGEK